MRIITTLIGILSYGVLLSQTPEPNELYKKIANYYQQNLNGIEFIKNIHKNALSYDTAIYTLAYIPLNKNDFYFFFIDSTFSVDDGLFYSDDYFILTTDKPEKIRLTRRDLGGSMYSWLDHVPPWHCSDISRLKSWLGNPQSIKKISGNYVVITNRFIVNVDTVSYRINKLTWIVYDKYGFQYNEYQYLKLPDSVENHLREDVKQFTFAAKDFPVTTWKEIEKQKPAKEIFEGKQFEFKNLVSCNKGSVDSLIQGKYLIFDFFYQACLPCHKMTGYILDWLPTVDTSKIVLIGVNPRDSEFSMKIEMEKRKINYPIIIGNQAKEIALRYVQEGYPNLLLVSPDGTIMEHHIGMSKSFLTKAEKIISQ